MIDVTKQLTQLIKARGWSTYRLAMESGLSQSTVSGWITGRTNPTLKHLEQICDLMGISLEEFFREPPDCQGDPQTALMLDRWRILSSEKRKAVRFVMDQMSR